MGSIREVKGDIYLGFTLLKPQTLIDQRLTLILCSAFIGIYPKEMINMKKLQFIEWTYFWISKSNDVDGIILARWSMYGDYALTAQLNMQEFLFSSIDTLLAPWDINNTIR